MNYGLNIPQKGAFDLIALGAMVHRLDSGVLPFRKAPGCQIHVSGGEFNVAANLADCFRLRTGIAFPHNAQAFKGQEVVHFSDVLRSGAHA